MRKAYDTLLQIPVSADNAASNSDNEAFRYECLCCGEEVFLAAQDSIAKATHFRHRSGNNDKICDWYLGQYGSLPTAPGNRRNKQERVEFYYNNLHKAFYIGLCFNETEIASYEESGISFEVSELRTSHPFFSISINHTNFCDNVSEMFMLQRYASPYYISNTSNHIKREYYVFRDTRPAFFKIQGDGEDFKAKYIKSISLYTNVKYFVAWSGHNAAQIKLSTTPGVEIEKQFQFKTMSDCSVLGMVIIFKEKNAVIDAQLYSWGYKLSVSEKLTLLWPPAFETSEIQNISSTSAYLFSTFMFKNYGNINIDNSSIHEISNSITRIDIKDKVKILNKNTEMTIFINDYKPPEDSIDIKQIKSVCFTVPEDGVYYLFTTQGVKNLTNGQKIFLTPKSYIAEYSGNYLTKRILMQADDNMLLEERIRDALSHYWIMIPYENMVNSHMPETVKKYLSDCQSKGYINQAVKIIIAEEDYD